MKRLGLLSLSVTLFSINAALGQETYELTEKVEAGTQVQTKLHLQVRGQIQAGDKEQPLAGQALLEYPEKVLEVGDSGLAKRVIRAYVDARAKFVVGTGEDPRQLRREARLMVGDHSGAKLTLWAPAGPIASDERELVEDVLDTTRLPGLLPKEPVKIADKWQPNPDVMQALSGLQNFISSDVQCTLTSATDEVAVIDLVGGVHGLDHGAEVKSKITGKLTFNRKTSIIEQGEWSQTDARGPGPVSPTGAYEVKITVTRGAAESPYLTEAALKGVSLDPNPASQLLVFEGPDKSYRFFHDRSWHVTAVQPGLVVMRQMKESDFVAQLNIAVLPERKAGTKMSADEFQQTIAKTGGWTIEQIVKTVELPTDGTFDLQLVSAFGQSGNLRLAQRHYLATSKTGKQAIFSFIMEPQSEEKLGTADLSMVGTVEFPENVASNPQPPVQ